MKDVQDLRLQPCVSIVRLPRHTERVKNNIKDNLIYNPIYNLVSMFFGRILNVAMSLKSCMGTCDVVALWASQGFVLSPFVALGTIVVGFVLRLISFFAF